LLFLISGNGKAAALPLPPSLLFDLILYTMVALDQKKQALESSRAAAFYFEPREENSACEHENRGGAMTGNIEPLARHDGLPP
jgi:hypothetical protein